MVMLPSLLMLRLAPGGNLAQWGEAGTICVDSSVIVVGPIRFAHPDASNPI
jgi:hypothetical protein